MVLSPSKENSLRMREDLCERLDRQIHEPARSICKIIQVRGGDGGSQEVVDAHDRLSIFKT
jgi:hypothetical protein